MKDLVRFRPLAGPKDSKFVLTGATALKYQRVKHEGLGSNP